MTDVAVRPARSDDFVSMFDPQMENFAEKMRQRIKEDLSSLGEVYRIDGEIAVTRNHGVRMENVVAKIKHRSYGTAIHISVSYSKKLKEPVYHNAAGNEFIPLTKHYGVDLLEAPEREVVNETFELLDNHPAFAYGFNRRAETRVNQGSRQMHYLMTMFPASMASGTGIVLGLDLWTLLAVPAAWAGALWWNYSLLSETDQEYEEHCAGVRAWNADTKAVIPGLLGDQKMSSFMDALLTVCWQHGVEYKGKLNVSKAEVLDKERAKDYSSDSLKDIYDRCILRAYTVGFTVKPIGGKKAMHAEYDGQHLYVTHEGCREHQRRTEVVPLTLKNVHAARGQSEAQPVGQAETLPGVFQRLRRWTQGAS